MVRKVGLYNWRCDLDLMLKALAHKARRNILKTVTQKPSNLKNLAAEHHISITAVSKHVGKLQRAKLVVRNRVIQDMIVQAVPGRLLTVKKYLDNYQEYWQELDRRTRDCKVLE